MKNIVITSCGIIKKDFKDKFYKIINKDELSKKKVLYITTAADGEDGDKSWMENEYNTILDLGVKKDNIYEYKIGDKINIKDFDIMYMMGGNTFYLLDQIRKYNFDKVIKKFIYNNKIYIGSSAGSIILGNSIKYTLGFDENNVNMTDFRGLKLVDGIIIPHANRKEELINSIKDKEEKIYLLYDGDGIIMSTK